MPVQKKPCIQNGSFIAMTDDFENMCNLFMCRTDR